MKHTPTPYEADEVKIWHKAHCIAVTNGGHNAIDDKANAAFIARACNSHDELVDALKTAHVALKFHPGGDSRMEGDIKNCESILTKAKGEA